MRQRRVPPKRAAPSAYAQLHGQRKPEDIYLNQKGREWLKRQIQIRGKGKWLLKKWSVRTPNIKEKAWELSRGKNALQATQSILRFLSTRIEMVETGKMTAAKFYGRQTADDLIITRKMPTFPGKHYGALGCQTFCAAMMALLRAAKPVSGKISKVRAVRTISPRWAGTGEKKVVGMPHTIVTFEIDGVRYVADPFKKGYSFLGTPFIGKKGKKMVPYAEIERKIMDLKKSGYWKEALDPADFGINSFAKYIEESRKSGADIALFVDFEEMQREIQKSLQ